MCTSSSPDAQAKQVLEKFLEGQLSLSEVQIALHNRLLLDFDLAPAYRRILKADLDTNIIQVFVTRDHVREMLERYLQGEVSGLDLSNWAALVFMLPVFVPEGETDDERWEAGSSPTWTILQRLVTPELFGGLGPEIVQQYLESLTEHSLSP